MIERIVNKPNYFNGKLYKRWDSVLPLFAGDGVLACKTNKDGSITEIIITGGGKKRELIGQNSKVMDINGSDETKRTYIYKRHKNNDSDIIQGRMITSVKQKNKPSILSAGWTIADLKPLSLSLKLNIADKISSVFVPQCGKIDKSVKFRAESVHFKDFNDNTFYAPKTVLFKSPDGETKIVKDDSLSKRSWTSFFGVNSDILGNYLSTIV